MAEWIKLNDKIIRNYWTKVDKRGPDDCWPWIGTLDRSGYGRFWAGAPCYAHQVALAVDGQERPLSPFHHALHGDCSNRSCVNPAHLRWGSISENMKDRGRLNRAAHLKGETNGNAKLTEDDVRLIRSTQCTRREMAERFGVSISLISMVRLRRVWTHVT